MNAIETSAVQVVPFGTSRFAAFLNAVEAALQWLGALILAVLLVLVLTSVTLRYVFGSGLIWSEELAIWLNVLLVAIDAPLTWKAPSAPRTSSEQASGPRTHVRPAMIASRSALASLSGRPAPCR